LQLRHLRAPQARALREGQLALALRRRRAVPEGAEWLVTRSGSLQWSWPRGGVAQAPRAPGRPASSCAWPAEPEPQPPRVTSPRRCGATRYRAPAELDGAWRGSPRSRARSADAVTRA